jgi:hypothetical protein
VSPSGRNLAVDLVGPAENADDGPLRPGWDEPWTPARLNPFDSPTTVARRTSDDAVNVAVRQFATADRTARLLAEDAGAEFFHFYQPSVNARANPVAGEPEVQPERRSEIQRFRDRLPDDVIDLAGVLDDDPRPLFFDYVHTVEAAHVPIADAIVDRLEPALRTLSGERPPCP